MPADQTADRDDLLALQAGDDDALARLITRWERPLFAFAWRYLRNSADARELAIETFVRLHQHAPRLRPDTNLSAWLFTTLANLCRNQRRWWRRHPTVSLDGPERASTAPDIATGLVEQEASPDASLEEREILAALDEAIAALPHDLRTTLLLHHFEHLSYQEIAAITGCSERGVETRLYRARRALRTALRPTPAPA